MTKLEKIYSYIKRCDAVIGSRNMKDAKKLQSDIIGVFKNEIKDIEDQLDNFDWIVSNGSPRQVDFIGDADLLKQKLENHAANIKADNDAEKRKMKHELEMAKFSQPIASAYVQANQTQTINIEISFEEVEKQIDKINESQLSSNDKETLKEYLIKLDNIKSKKDKVKFWNKAKEVLDFILDKGVDVAIAMLPYIISGITQ